jgi:hypothetical protein
MTDIKPRVSPLERFPDHVRAIGMITIEMCNLEASLCHLLGAILAIEEPLAGALFFSPKTTRGRIEMLENVLDELASGPPLKVAGVLVKRANKILNKRNDVVHEIWGVSKDRTEVFRITPPYKKPRAVPLVELTQIINSLRRLADEVEALSSTIRVVQRSHSHYIVNVTCGEGPVVADK